MASDHSHPMTGIGRRPAFALGLLVAVLAPALAGSPYDASAALAVALVSLAVAVAALSSHHAATLSPAWMTAVARADRATPYLSQRVTDPVCSPRRPRAPECA